MAEAFIPVAQDQFTCPVCLDLLKDPVTVPCGHSYCKVCINDCWDQEDEKGVYSCPQCRYTFTHRPILHRNNMLAEVVEKLKKTEVQAASPAHCYAGPGDVECDFCTGRKLKAIKSCLMCLTSFCETHLKPHLELPALKKHTLIHASSQLKEKICSQHDKLMEIYCRTDQKCICSLCMLENHKGHDAVSLSAERTEKQRELKEEQLKSQQRIQEKQKKVQELKQAVNMIKFRAQTAVEDSEIIFTEMISFMEKKRLEVTELIRAQEKAEVSRAERLLEQLEQEITDLKRRVTELEQLSHTQDHIHFLQSFQSLSVSSGCEDSPSITVHQQLSFNGVRNSLSDLKKRFEEFCEEEFNKFPPHAAAIQKISPSEQNRFSEMWSGAVLEVCTSQSHIKRSGEKDGIKSVNLEATTHTHTHTHTHRNRKPRPLITEKTKLIGECQFLSLSLCFFRKMAEASILDHFSVDQFSCPVCLDLLKDPVTTRCGHSYCKVCINGCWNQEDEKGVYSCPQCRDTFTPRPVLHRNNMLAEVVEKLKKTEVQAASPAHCYAGPGDVECDFCTGRKLKAIKSCLMCLTSFCETHLKPHLELPALKKHTLIEASSQLQEKICPQHDKLMEIYCRTDQKCICSLCMLDNHKGHDAVSLSAGITEKQSKLKKEQLKFQQRIQEKQKKVQELKQAVNMIKSRAQTAVEDSEIIFTEMISFMEKKRSEVMELIRAQEKAELRRAERLLEQLEQEITDLKRRVTELEQLSHTQDHIHFLQSFQSLSVSSGCEYSPSITVHQQLSFDGVRNSLSDLKKRLEQFCEEELNKIPPHAAAVQKISPSEPKSRDDFLKYFCYLTLDPNTANHNLHLSEENRVVTYSWIKQPYSNHPERFDSSWQVLCKESVCGRCYWEVQWSGGGVVYISVSYKEIRRKGEGKDCRFGLNSQSWSLCCSSSSLSFYHDDITTELGVPSSSRIGVYVDHSAGSLSFYSVSDTMRLLHRVHTIFAQPLYAGFKVYRGTVRLCDPK
ncbi:E3 ubiquitin/ISG15 ligase TRIM25-like [Pangasianodon hypophthalmus]|uniref:E3 ubiquitin/ISG15 ligase TRIM25-like n=1 Tax=Pangasianodon hypophthalmus TaxID=310915 RepID=UPI002307925A|nr:E3 ubiquitin/ISG15 ligase TRIM25-like [Pangasianodon hypophthalmus]